MYITRLQSYYEQIIRPDFIVQYGLKNIYQIPRLDRIILHSSIAGESGGSIKKRSTSRDHKLVVYCAAFYLLTGRRVRLKRCKTAVAAFQIRQHDALGCQVILQGPAMFNFLDELITVIWPRNTRPDFEQVKISSSSLSGYSSSKYTTRTKVNTHIPVFSDNNRNLLFDLDKPEILGEVNTSRVNSTLQLGSNCNKNVLKRYSINFGFSHAFLWPCLENHYDFFQDNLGFQVTIQIQAVHLADAIALCNALQIPCYQNS